MDYLKKLQDSWNWFGKNDPFWAVNSLPEKRNNRWDKYEFFQTGIEEIEKIITHLGTLNLHYKKERAMDFGCGVGRLSQPLARHFDEVCGVDISAEMLESARLFCPDTLNCRFILNQAPDLKQFESNSFDFIYTSIVLQHIHPKVSREYLKEFLRLLKPEGVVVFQIPEKMAISIKGVFLKLVPSILSTMLFKFKNKCPVAMEMHCISRAEIVKLVQKHNGKMIDIQSGWAGGGNLWCSTRYYAGKQE